VEVISVEGTLTFASYVQRLTDAELEQLLHDTAKEELARWQRRQEERLGTSGRPMPRR